MYNHIKKRQELLRYAAVPATLVRTQKAKIRLIDILEPIVKRLYETSDLWKKLVTSLSAASSPNGNIKHDDAHAVIQLRAVIKDDVGMCDMFDTFTSAKIATMIQRVLHRFKASRTDLLTGAREAQLALSSTGE
jgi:acetylglutamate synthase